VKLYSTLELCKAVVQKIPALNTELFPFKDERLGLMPLKDEPTQNVARDRNTRLPWFPSTFTFPVISQRFVGHRGPDSGRPVVWLAWNRIFAVLPQKGLCLGRMQERVKVGIMRMKKRILKAFVKEKAQQNTQRMISAPISIQIPLH
jgi:hypothetical protein